MGDGSHFEVWSGLQVKLEPPLSTPVVARPGHPSAGAPVRVVDSGPQHAKAIRVNRLDKSYQKLQVLKGVDFDVASGSIFALLGSNGAGKTTIVKILATLLKPDDGTASVNGFDVQSQPAQVRESISLTGQFAAVDEILTGRENLVMIAKLRQVENPRRVADDLLERFGLPMRPDAGCRLTRAACAAVSTSP
jgi:ABC-type uncharacterized transport system ATPase subunit